MHTKWQTERVDAGGGRNWRTHLAEAAAPAIAVAAVALALGTQFAISEHQDIPGVGVGLVLAVVLLGAAVLVDGRRRAGAPQVGAHEPRALALSRRWEIGFVSCVIALAAFFRFYHLDSFPAGLWSDESVNAIDAIGLIHGDHFRLWSDSVMGRPTLYLYLLALSLRVFGYSVFAVRIVPALAGLAAVVAFYFLARRIVTPVPALLATALLAVSRWAVTFSRISWEASVVPALEILAVYFFMKATDTGRRLYFALGSFTLAAGFYTYVAFRIVPVVILAFLLLATAANWRWVRGHLRGLALYAVVFSIAVAPLAIFTLQHEDKVLERTRTVSVFREIDRADSYAPLRHNFDATWRMFNVRGDPNGRHNIPFAPMVDDVTAVLLILGIGVAAWSVREWRRCGVLIWFVLALIPGALSLQVENPSAIRDLGAVPPLYLLVGLATSAIYRVMAPTRIGMAMFVAGAAMLVGGSIVTNYDDTFNTQAADRTVYDGFQPTYTRIGEAVARDAPSASVYVSSQFNVQSAINVLGHGKVTSATYGPAHDLIFHADGRDVVLFIDGGQFWAMSVLARLYPNMARADYTDPFGRVPYSEVRIPASDIANLSDATAAPLVRDARQAEALPTSMLLTPSDLAAGTWTVLKDSSKGGVDGPPPDPNAVANQRCGLLRSETIVNGTPSPTYNLVKGGMSLIFSTASVYATADGAIDCAAAAAQRIAQPGAFASPYGISFTDASSVHVTPIEWPSTGDGSFAFTLAGPAKVRGGDFDLTVLVVVIRSGNVTAIIGAAGSGGSPTAAELAPLVDVVARRISASR